MLVIGNTLDPSTPYHDCVALSQRLARVRLRAVDGHGHAALLNRSTCADNYESRYLIDGIPRPGNGRSPRSGAVPALACGPAPRLGLGSVSPGRCAGGYHVLGMSGSRGLSDRLAGRSPGNRSLRLALSAFGTATLVVAGIELALFAQAPHVPLWVLVLYLAVGVEYVLGGLLAWSRRPSNRTGLLLCVGGLMLLVAALENAGPTALTVTGLILAQAPVAAVLHALLAFPSGRCKDVVTRGLVVAGYVTTIGLRAPQYLFGSVTSRPMGYRAERSCPSVLL